MNAYTKQALTVLANELSPEEGFWFDALPEPDFAVEQDEHEFCDCRMCCPELYYDDHATVEQETEIAWEDHREYLDYIDSEVTDSWLDFRGWEHQHQLDRLVKQTTDDLWEEWERLMKDLRFHLAVNVFIRDAEANRLATEIKWYEWYLDHGEEV